MRLMFLSATLILFLVGCGGEAKQKSAEPKKEEQKSEPVDLGDNTAPIEVRALRGAKEVRTQIDTQRKENKNVVDEANK